jgi:hypothetical protein
MSVEGGAPQARFISQPSLVDPEKEAGTKDFQCDRCPRTFTRRENLARHANSRRSPFSQILLRLPFFASLPIETQTDNVSRRLF